MAHNIEFHDKVNDISQTTVVMDSCCYLCGNTLVVTVDCDTKWSTLPLEVTGAHLGVHMGYPIIQRAKEGTCEFVSSLSYIVRSFF